MPTPQFWTAEDKIPISQTQVSIPAENGLAYSANQKINFHIPPTVGFLQPKESYLKFDVKVKKPASASATPTRLQLDAEIGGQVLIRDIRVSSGGAGNVLLEEIQNYNVMVAMKYDYDTNDSLKAKRSLTEGATIYNPQQRCTHGCKKSQGNNLTECAYWKPPLIASTTADYTDDDQYDVKCLLPLHTGIFQNDKIFPTMLTEGLRIEIVLEGSVNVFRQLDTVVQDRRLLSHPIFHSVNGSDVAPSGFESTSPASSFFCRIENNIGAEASLANFPLCVGETVAFFSASESKHVKSTDGPGGDPTIASIEMSTGDNMSQSLVKVTLNNAYTPSGGATNIIRPGDIVCSGAVALAVADGRTPSYQPTYEINNCEMVIQQLQMPAGYMSKMMSMMKSGGTMNYDFLATTNYKIAQQSGETVANLRLPLVESRAKSVLCIPIDSTPRSAADAISGSGTYVEDKFPGKSGTVTSIFKDRSVRSGLVGIWDNLSRYQLMYDGKLNPNRKVECAKSASQSIDQQPIIELEKALAMAGIEPHSFLKFKENFVLGRALSLQDGVYDARGKDFNLQVEYDQVGLAPEFNKLWNCYCFHLRRMVVRGGQLSVEV